MSGAASFAVVASYCSTSSTRRRLHPLGEVDLGPAAVSIGRRARPTRSSPLRPMMTACGPAVKLAVAPIDITRRCSWPGACPAGGLSRSWRSDPPQLDPVGVVDADHELVLFVSSQPTSMPRRDVEGPLVRAAPAGAGRSNRRRSCRACR